MFDLRNTAQSLIQARMQHPGWRLLAARRAPLVLASAQLLFEAAEDGVEWETAVQALSELLAEYANDDELGGGDDFAASARAELREWIKLRLIVERENRLYATHALEQALDFVSGLEQRVMTSTASRLSVVQREIENLDIHLNPDAETRADWLRRKIAQLEQELEQVEKGRIPVLSRPQAEEAIRELYTLAAGLRADFRRVEDSYRQADRALRERIIASESHRGEVLDKLLDSHEHLLETREGQVFQGFFEQLKSEAVMREARERLRNIIRHPYSSTALDYAQRSELRWLFVRLNKESETVLRARERSESDVRGFLRSGLVDEHHRVGELLDALQKAALEVDWSRHALRTQASVLPPVSVDCAHLPLIERLRIKSLQDQEQQTLELSRQCIDLDQIEDDFWRSFDSLDQQALWRQTLELLQQENTSMSIAELARRLPPEPQHDLETLVFWLNLAQDAGVPVDNAQRESLDIEEEAAGRLWRFHLPLVELNAEALTALERETEA